MDTVCNNNECSGCNACVEICKKRAITLVDDLYHYNAVIDLDKCVKCGRCHSVCPQQSVDLLAIKEYYQGWAISNTIRKKSSSGGAATVLAMEFIKKGGIVCSCSYAQEEFGFSIATSIEQLNDFVGSKYVKSNPKKAYNAIKELLENRKKVLFIGLPCQVAAMKKYIGKKWIENLYTIDLICHGTPSPKILRAFLKDKCVNTKYSRVDFRDSCEFAVSLDGEKLDKTIAQDAYLSLFLNGAIYTDNCYSCKFATEKRVADITLGDSWGSDLPESELKQGISLILIQTDKGKSLLDDCELILHDVDLDNAIAHNHQLKIPMTMPNNRKKIMDDILNGKSLDRIVLKYYPRIYIKHKIKKVLRG